MNHAVVHLHAHIDLSEFSLLLITKCVFLMTWKKNAQIKFFFEFFRTQQIISALSLVEVNLRVVWKNFLVEEVAILEPMLCYAWDSCIEGIGREGENAFDCFTVYFQSHPTNKKRAKA